MCHMMSCEDEDTCMSDEEEDTSMSCEEEDASLGHRQVVSVASPSLAPRGGWHGRRYCTSCWCLSRLTAVSVGSVCHTHTHIRAIVHSVECHSGPSRNMAIDRRCRQSGQGLRGEGRVRRAFGAANARIAGAPASVSITAAGASARTAGAPASGAVSMLQKYY